MSGICVDALNPAGCPSADTLFVSGADGGRIVAFDSPLFFAYAGDLLMADLTVAVVLARESFPTEDYGGMAAFYAERCSPTLWVCGNEMDAGRLPEPSPSSWKMEPQEFADFWLLTATVIKERQPDAKILIGGLVSGDVSYLDELLGILPPPAPYGADIHPYSKGPAEAGELLDMYRAVGVDALRDRLRAYRVVLEAHGI